MSETHNNSVCQVATSDQVAEALRERAGKYFAEIRQRRVFIQLKKTYERANSTLYQFDVVTDATRNSVVVKIPVPRKKAVPGHLNSADSRTDRPRLFPKAPFAGKFQLEYESLVAIHERFGIADPRFGVVRVLDLLPEQSAIVMESVREPSLSRLCRQANSFKCRRGGPSLDSAFENAGAWLRTYHQLPGLTHTTARNTCQRDFINSIDYFVDYLSTGERTCDFLPRIRESIITAAQSVLPAELPLGLSHGDYRPHNIFVGTEGRTTVFDTLARWQAPIYEDISQFVHVLRISRDRCYSFGLTGATRCAVSYEEAFLRGYFARAAIPAYAIRLFESQLLLERWASILHRYRESKGVKGFAKGCRLFLWTRFVRRYLGRVADDLGRGQIHEGRMALVLSPTTPRHPLGIKVADKGLPG